MDIPAILNVGLAVNGAIFLPRPGILLFWGSILILVILGSNLAIYSISLITITKCTPTPHRIPWCLVSGHEPRPRQEGRMTSIYQTSRPRGLPPRFDTILCLRAAPYGFPRGSVGTRANQFWLILRCIAVKLSMEGGFLLILLEDCVG